MDVLQSKFGLAAAALSMALLGAPVANAAQDSSQGNTSGPASGKMTTPGTASQKQASTQAGAPGVEGKQGAESGAAPGAPKAESRTKAQQ
nr:hypothetical protein [uncultured Rhodopila sp.]